MTRPALVYIVCVTFNFSFNFITNERGRDMTKKQQQQLDKVFALYNDSAARETEESAAAYAKLQQLCKKYSVDFEAFLKSKGAGVETQEEAKAEATVVDFMRSRRAYIIEKLQTGLYDKATLAEEVALFFSQYGDMKKNKAAVSGTIYDLTQHGKASCRTCEDGRLIFKLK